MRGLILVFVGLAVFSTARDVVAQPFENKKYGQEDKFRQLEEILPTPGC